jgi:predicted nucleotidyltransferase
MPAPARIESALSRIRADFAEVKLAILYGSAARGTMHAGSDVDLAVAADPRPELDPERLIDMSLACGDALGCEVQVRDLAWAQGVYLRQVLTEGAVVVERDPTVRGELIIRMLDFTEGMLANVRMIRRANTQRFIGGA